MNSSYYSDLETNFKEACSMCEKTYTHTELIEMLKNGKIPHKQYAALMFDVVSDEGDAKILLDNLTGCDGKIREAIAHTINRFLQNNIEIRLIFSKISAEILADATIDINGNICRLVLDSAILLKDYEIFSKRYAEKIFGFSNEALNEIDKFIFRDKKYVINKQIFKLYWCLEALNYFSEYLTEDELQELLIKTSEIKEYTIREKTAQIVRNINKFPALYQKLHNDENYYVRSVFN